MCAQGKENTRCLALGSNSLKQRTDAGGRLCCLVRTVAGFRLLGAGAPRGAGEEDLYNGGGKCSKVQGSAGVQGADAAPHNSGQSTIVVSGGGRAGLVPGQTVHSVQAVMLQKSAISLRRQSF